MRKKAASARKTAGRLLGELRCKRVDHIGSVREVEPARIRDGAGVYILRKPDVKGERLSGVLYVGQTSDVRNWIARSREREMFNRSPFVENGGESIAFYCTASGELEDDSRRRAMQSYLVGRHPTMWNDPTLGFSAA